MSEKFKILILISVICFFGITSRLFTFQSSHPDSDELFELSKMQYIKPADIFKNSTFYGDHTSFPGEYLVHYLPMKALGLFKKPAEIDIQGGKIAGITKTGFWILAIPKIIITLLSFVLFYFLCGRYVKTPFGYAVAFALLLFNSHLIYHAFSLRPYGILTELAIINLFLASKDAKKPWFSGLHGAVVLFTCVYHAYGPLIAFLPILANRRARGREFNWFVLAAIFAWVYYATYNTFGMAPNKVQSVVNTFQFITKENFLNGVVDSIFTGSLITVATLPFVLLGLPAMSRRQLAFLLLFIVLPMLAIMLVDIKTQYWIHPRQYLWCMPAIALWAGMVVENEHIKRTGN